MEGIQCRQLVIKWLADLYEEFCHLGGSAFNSRLADWAFSSGSSYISPCDREPVLLGPRSVLIPATVAAPFTASAEVADSIWLTPAGESLSLLGCLVPLSS